MAWADFTAPMRARSRVELPKMLQRAYWPSTTVQNGLPVLSGAPQDKRFVLLMSQIAEGHGCTYNTTTGAFVDAGVPLPPATQ